MPSSDWLNLRGWIESGVGWSMDNVHDALPAGEVDLQATISLPTGIWPEDIHIGPIFSPREQFAAIQPALELFFTATMICTIVFTTLMLTILPIP